MNYNIRQEKLSPTEIVEKELKAKKELLRREYERELEM